MVTALQLCFRIYLQEYPRYSERLELNGIPQLLVYADGINTFTENINNKTHTLLEASREVGVCVCTKYMDVSRHQNGGQNHN
jgi:hypothetical protein